MSEWVQGDLGLVLQIPGYSLLYYIKDVAAFRVSEDRGLTRERHFSLPRKPELVGVQSR